MSTGGPRNRGGRPVDPNSARQDRLGRASGVLTLPAEGYSGEAPPWPLSDRLVLREEYDAAEKVTRKVADPEQSALIKERELAMWAWAWTTPQACAWAMPSERWRLHTVAMWVRTFVVCESSDATAADKGSLHRFADQIGLTPAGLRENGWAVARDELGERAASKPEPEVAPAPVRRMRAVPGGG